MLTTPTPPTTKTNAAGMAGHYQQLKNKLHGNLYQESNNLGWGCDKKEGGIVSQESVVIK